MALVHFHRLLIGIPAARQAAVNAWVRDNLNPEGDDWFVVGASPSGAPPATHYVCSVALTNTEIRAILQQLAQGLIFTWPPLWDTWDRAEKRLWLRLTALPFLHANTPYRFRHMDNDAEWDDVEEVLAEFGVQFVEEP